jgi:UDP-N-acetylmuramyl tripeptide synthase
MRFLDARRLTGPSLLFDRPGSILDVRCTQPEAERLVPAWQRHLRRMLARLDWPGEPEIAVARLAGGVSLGFTAPIDALYAASELNEWAFSACEAELEGSAEPDFEAAAGALKAALAEEANPRLLAIAAAAAEHGVSMLWDDDAVSLGMGRHSQTWPVRELPDPASLAWDGFADVPVGIVTGTNGKTTTVRLAAHILGAAGYSAGLSSTDYIAIGGRVVDRDDWAGPGGARSVLRSPEVDAAILETARGGLLRRGLGVERADAALITNIAKDHLGDFGSRNMKELLNIKWIVSRAVRSGGKLVLNADDPRLRRQAEDYAGEIVWFSLRGDRKLVRAHTAAGGAAFVFAEGALQFDRAGSRELLAEAAEVPITLGGAARHNVANALAAAALTWSMGVDAAAIREGLRSMAQGGNPGRGNLYQVDGRTVLVDFAHNPEALRAILETAARMPAKRRALCFGQAGDRPDALIRELARTAWRGGLDRVYVSELAKYYRGRGPGEVFAVISAELRQCGAREDQVVHHAEELDTLEAALAWAEPGDLVIMLALERSQALYDRLRGG